MERSLTRDEERIEVLDKMVMRLYEDMIAGRISEQNFNTMLEKTQTEQTELKTKVSEGRKRLSDEVQLANDAKQWVEAIQEYANITELDAATLNRLSTTSWRSRRTKPPSLRNGALFSTFSTALSTLSCPL